MSIVETFSLLARLNAVARATGQELPNYTERFQALKDRKSLFAHGGPLFELEEVNSELLRDLSIAVTRALSDRGLSVFELSRDNRRLVNAPKLIEGLLSILEGPKPGDAR